MKLEINFSLDMTETETLALMERRQAQNETETEQQMNNAHAVQTETATEKPQTETQTDETEKTTDEYKEAAFDKAVNYLIGLDGEQFYELVEYARDHDNFFPSFVNELREVVNADDVYASAVIRMTRHLGETYENFMISRILHGGFRKEREDAFNAAKAAYETSIL